MKVLWLCSWYPNSKDPFDGDFIERQAKALAQLQQVDVIHVVQNFELLKDETTYRAEEQVTGALTSNVYFLPLPTIGNTFIKKVWFNRRYNQFVKKILENYIQEKGKPDLVHVHVPVKAGAAALWLKKIRGIPFIVTEHNSAYFEHIPDNYFNRNRYFRFIAKQSFQKAAAVSSVSNWLLNRLNELFSIEQRILIRNAVDTSLFFPYKKSNAVKRFIHVSMMLPLKNVNGILQSLALLNEHNSHWEMIFAGPASEQQMQLAIDLGIHEKIIWKGTLPYNEVAGEIQQADALVHFSNYENLPCVINEALCCGVPVISSDVGGIAELIHEHNGILVEKGNTLQLANAMNTFLQHQDQYNHTDISAAASAQFNYETIGRAIEKMYKKILADLNFSI